MPVFRKISLNDDQIIAIWKITESMDDFTQMATELNIDMDLYPNAKIEIRNKQWLATRLLVAAFEPNPTISYDEYGKPLLSNQTHLSISHAKHFVAIHLSTKKQNGIDIEEVSSKVERIKHKFLGEQDCLSHGTTEELTLCWSAKESLFKYYGKGEVDFSMNLHILDINHSLQRMQGAIKMATHSENVQLGWKKIDNFVLVYTI